LLQIVYPDNPGHVEDELAQMASDYFDLEDKHCWGPDWEYLFETLAARCGIKPAAARKMTWTEIAEALKAACQRTAISGRIPPERRTIPMSKHDAARLMGYTRPDEYGRNRRSTKDAVALLTKSMQDGIIKAEQQSRQRYVFDREDFPKEVHHKIIPSLNRSSP
jgi:hypothetical protein